MKRKGNDAAMKMLSAALAASGIPLWMKADDVEQLQTRVNTLLTQCKEIEKNAASKGRPMDADERKNYRELLAEAKAIQEELDLRDGTDAMIEMRAQPKERKTKQEGYEFDRVEAVGRSTSPGANGFKRSGELFQAVARRTLGMSLDSGTERRLQMAAASTYGSEGVGADGGFAAPEDIQSGITDMIMGEQSLLSRCNVMQTSSNVVRRTTSEATPWGSTGVQVYWRNEAPAITQSKPDLKHPLVSLEELTALVPVTGEELEDAPLLESHIRDSVGKAMTFAVNLALLQGTGAGQPLGVLKSGALVTVAKESGQTADTVIHQNVENMYGRLYAPFRRGAVWVCNQDVETQFGQMSFKNTDAAGPAFIQPGGPLNQGSYPLLKNLPVISTEACEQLGDLGDIMLVAFPQYTAYVKVGGMRSDVSIHFWFDQNITAFRFIMRLAGQPDLSAPIARRSGSNTLSSCVALAAR